MPPQKNIKLYQDPRYGMRWVIRVDGVPLTADAIRRLDGISAFEPRNGYLLLFPCAGRDCESICQDVEKALGVFRS
ncbi:MAG: hypothetical protein GX484_05260 [Chloroflexi bacterium]|nr:hypothetical protein [Chloroflexota bacterium]